MSNNILVVDSRSALNCFSVHLSMTRITLRCTPGFANAIRTLVVEGGDGFGGVEFTEKGNSWYELTPRETWGPTRRRVADATLKGIFLYEAFASLKALLERLDVPVTFESRNDEDHVFIHRRTVVVNARPSSAGFRSNQPTTQSVSTLIKRFSRAGHRHLSR